MKLPFSDFKSTMFVAIHFSDSMSTADIDEVINDLYVLYKELRYNDAIEFLKFHMPIAEVNRDTHSFWLDEKGLFLLHHAKHSK